MNRRNLFETRSHFLKNWICRKNFVVVILMPSQTTWLLETAC